MSEMTCPGCQERDAAIAALPRRIGQLEQPVRDLEARLGRNASNSSLPPSANPPSAPPPGVQKGSRRRTGGQPGHPGHQRQRLPRERVHHVIPRIPATGEGCQTPLPADPSPGDPDPVWHPFAERPRVAAVVTESQGPARTGPACSHVPREASPAELRAHAFGPRLAAVRSYLGGCPHVSQRGLGGVVEAVFGVPLSVGTVDALQGPMTHALDAPHQEIADHVRQAPAKNVDETGWEQAGTRHRLGAAVTATAVRFVVHARRGAAGLRALRGEQLVGLVRSGRWSAYGVLPVDRRQVCWAHLRRDFPARVDRQDAGGEVGQDLLDYPGVVFESWDKVRDGTRQRAWLARQIDHELRPEVRAALARGAACGCAKTAGGCAEIRKGEPALGTFARVDGVEPTNNAAERALRPAVGWRKESYGCPSEDGCRSVGRLLRVTQTLRLLGRPVLDYLTEALDAHRSGLPIPRLLPGH